MTDVPVNENDGIVTVTATSNGQTEFDFDFLVFSSAWVKAIFTEVSTGDVTTLELNTQFSVSGVGQANGGTVTLIGLDVSVGDQLIIYRDVPIQRISDFQQSGDFFANTVNTEEDVQTLIMQDLRREVDRAVKFGLDVLAPSFSAQPGQVLVVSSDGQGVVGQAAVPGTIEGFYTARNADNAQAAAALADGLVIGMGGRTYRVDSSATGTASATADLGVDGLVYAAAPTFLNRASFVADSLPSYPVDQIVIAEKEAYAFKAVANDAVDFDIQTSGGARFKFVPTSHIPLDAFGFGLGATPAENTAAYNKAVARAIETGTRTIVFPATPNIEPIYVNKLELPTFTEDDPLQEPDRDIKIIGQGELRTWIALPDDDQVSDYVIGHGSSALTDRAQNTLLQVRDMRITRTGAKDVDKPVCLLDNSWAALIENVLAYGNNGGDTFQVHSRKRGGAQSIVFNRVRDLKDRLWEKYTSETEYDISKLRRIMSRYLIGAHGYWAETGKANNIVATDCEVYLHWMGLMDTLPLEGATPPDYDSAIFPNGGGADWARLRDCFAGFEASTKIETGVFDGVLSQFQFDLVQRTTFTGDGVTEINGIIVPNGETVITRGVNRNNGDYVDCVLRVLNPADGYWYSRRITSHINSIVTIETAFPFTVVSTDQYEIAMADAQHWADNGHPGIRPHLLRHSSLAYRAHIRDSRVEEGISCVRMSYAGTDNITIANVDEWSTRQEGMMVYDSTGERPDYWFPSNADGLQPVGARAANAHAIRRTLMLGQSGDFSSEVPIQAQKKAAQGQVIPSGVWVRVANNQEDLELPVNNTNAGWTQHAYAWNPAEQEAWDDEPCSIVVIGYMPVNVWLTANQEVTIGDVIRSRTYALSGDVGAIVEDASLTTFADSFKVLGRIEVDFTQGPTDGIAKLWATISMFH